MTVEAQLAVLSEQLTALTKKVDDAAEKREEQDERLEHIEDRLSRLESSSIADWVQQHWKVVAMLSTVMPMPLLAMTVGLWQMYGDNLIDFLRAELRESQARDMILFQPPGLSFIREPVTQGGKATYILVAKRTEVGAGCVYQGMVPIFTDELGRSLTGAFESQSRQYGTELTRTELSLDVPAGLLVGRITVELQITYNCDGEMLNHRTDPIAFQLLPAPPGP